MYSLCQFSTSPLLNEGRLSWACGGPSDHLPQGSGVLSSSIPACTLSRPNGCWRVRTMTEPKTRLPNWLAIDLTVIALSTIIIGIGLWIGLPWLRTARTHALIVACSKASLSAMECQRVSWTALYTEQGQVPTSDWELAPRLLSQSAQLKKKKPPGGG